VKRSPKKYLALALSLLMLGVWPVGCNSGGDTGLTGTIAISGSSALYPLARAAATQFKTDHADVAIIVSAGGSGTGLNNVLTGTVDIGNSDVYAAEKLTPEYAERLVDHKVCVVGIAVIVNAGVGATVTDLSTEQLQAIFSGSITNWSAVGGPNQAITIINRPTSSGTRALFVHWALAGQTNMEGDVSLQTDDSNALLSIVGTTPGAIGYLALSYLREASSNVSMVSINGVAATYSNIYNNSYQIWGFEHMYTLGQPNALTQSYLDFVVSPAMAEQTEALGYGLVSRLDPAAAGSH